MPAEGFTDGIGYLTNSVKLYKYPYLTSLLTVTELEKNTAVTVLGKIDTLDYRYYYVSYTDTDGTVRTGYVPQGYVTNFDGAPPDSQNFEVGAGKADYDSLWRLAFLLLGLRVYLRFDRLSHSAQAETLTQTKNKADWFYETTVLYNRRILQNPCAP